MVALDLSGVLPPHDGSVNAKSPKAEYLSVLLLDFLQLKLCGEAILQDYLVICKIHRQHLVQSQIGHSLFQVLDLASSFTHLSLDIGPSHSQWGVCHQDPLS